MEGRMYTISKEDVNVMLLLCIIEYIMYVNLNVYHKATGQTNRCLLKK